MKAMSEAPSAIIPCPSCKVKNRIKQFYKDKAPLCAKCGTRLVSEDENNTQYWFGKSLSDISNIPNPEYFGDS